MPFRKLIKIDNVSDVTRSMYNCIEKMYPICRSITGDGIRKSLVILKNIIPLNIIETKTGTQVYDWKVPDEWNINDAYICNSKGEKIIDFQEMNLHVVNYSDPIHKRITLRKLKQHCYSIPEHPDWIPYRTTYYNRSWGFCLSDNLLNSLPEDEYEVFIDSTLKPGFLTYGEYLIKGESKDEVLIYSHICHPSLCNDNLSGLSVASHLAKQLQQQNLRYSYRFVFGPGTIGSITWLSQNEDIIANIKHGLVIVLVGDANYLTYKKSRNGNSEIDRAVLTALKDHKNTYNILDFTPYGYDERQFCSPGINLPVGRLTRSVEGGYPEYHTSADNLDFIKKESLQESLLVCIDIVNIIENNHYLLNTNPKCEPQLGKRGLYKKTGGSNNVNLNELALLWVLNLSDGSHDLIKIAKKSGLSFHEIYTAAKELYRVGLLTVMNDQEKRSI